MAECMVCMEVIAPPEIYVVRCGSSVEHTMCQSCSERWRATMPGPMTCPTCRKEELVKKRVLPKYMQVQTDRIRPEWCQSGRLEIGRCFTKNKTSRECSMAGCDRRVCRACVMCDSHSDF